MATKQQQTKNQRDNRLKDPDQWTTGDEPMTGAQESYLHTLAQEAGEAADSNLTKAQASKKINRLQRKTGRGVPARGATARSRRR